MALKLSIQNIEDSVIPYRPYRDRTSVLYPANSDLDTLQISSLGSPTTLTLNSGDDSVQANCCLSEIKASTIGGSGRSD